MSVPRVVLVATIDYPEGPMADALEAQVLRTLVPLPGLEHAVSQEQRVAAYDAAIAQQRADFVEMYGCPFGWEKRSEPRVETVFSAGVIVRRLAHVN